MSWDRGPDGGVCPSPPEREGAGAFELVRARCVRIRAGEVLLIGREELLAAAKPLRLGAEGGREFFLSRSFLFPGHSFCLGTPEGFLIQSHRYLF